MKGATWRQWRRNWMDYPLRHGLKWAGTYRIEQFVGMGSYGQAYRCTDTATGSAVLLKRAKPSKGEVARRMLERESETMRRLVHPQIPKWLGEAGHRNETALVMEFAEGDTVEQLIMERGKTYAQPEALRVVRELLRPIKSLHEAGYVHRDVRIPNVLVCGDLVRLIDFGLACRIGEQTRDERPEETKDGQPAGFADSWGPVKQRMRVPCPTSDLYGLGHLFLFMMYASYEPGENREERSWEEELALEPDVRAFVRGLLEHEWPSAAECERELDRILEGWNFVRSG